MSNADTIDPDAFLEVLRRNRFSPSATAAALGMPRTTVYARMYRHPGIRIVNDIPAGDLRRQYVECDGDLDRLAELLQVSRRGLQLRLTTMFKLAAGAKRPLPAQSHRQLGADRDLVESLTLDKAAVDTLRAILGDHSVKDGPSLVEAVRLRACPKPDTEKKATPPEQGHADLGGVVALAQELLRRKKLRERLG